jgi:hypothetical protein
MVREAEEAAMVKMFAFVSCERNSPNDRTAFEKKKLYKHDSFIREAPGGEKS